MPLVFYLNPNTASLAFLQKLVPKCARAADNVDVFTIFIRHVEKSALESTDAKPWSDASMVAKFSQRIAACTMVSCVHARKDARMHKP